MTTPPFEEYAGNILVVDDTSLNLKLLSEMLTKHGYKVRAALNGEMAIMSVKANHPELILLDIKMDVMDGYEVCRRLKADPETQHIPIIFISALNETEDIVKAFDVGGVDYVTKPFNFPEVLARVKSQLTLARQRQQIEEGREKDRAYFETLSKIRDQFIRAATHDLKNPIALISGYVSLLKSHDSAVDNEELMEYAAGIQNGTRKLMNLVTDMLDLAQMESGLELFIEQTSLTAFLDNTVKDYLHTAEEKNITLVFTAPINDIEISVDLARMERVLSNLISNAIKYTASGGYVEVTGFKDNNHVVIQIIDNGYGIPEDALPQLFDAFYRVRKPKHMNEEGTGLGLSVVKSIVEQHAGEILVESELGKGSIFSIVLPFHQIPAKSHV